MKVDKRLGILSAASAIMTPADEYIRAFPRAAPKKKANANAAKQKQQRLARKKGRR